MPKIEDVALQLADLGLPVLSLDTCILLDIVRSLPREKYAPIEAARTLSSMLTVTPRTCALFLTSRIPDEWDLHWKNVMEETQIHLARIQKASSGFHEACEAAGIPLGFGRSDYAGAGLAEGLRDLASDLIKAAIRLERDRECEARAMDRLNSGRAPGSARKGQIGDCIIIEEFLAMAERLRRLGFTAKMIFCSSNTNDYCETTMPTKLATSLALEFDAVNLGFETNLSAAVHKLAR